MLGKMLADSLFVLKSQKGNLLQLTDLMQIATVFSCSQGLGGIWRAY